MSRDARYAALRRTVKNAPWVYIPPALAAEYPRPCDACGARVAGLVREVVEGIVCERCPTCRQEGAVP